MADALLTHGDAPAPVPPHVPVIDGFRGTSALLVAIFHCWLYTDAPLDGGPLRALTIAAGMGVDFFFVISGFVLFLPVVRRGGTFGSLWSYTVRRVARIVPAYYVALVVQAAATPVLTRFASPFASTGGWIVLLIHFLFLQHSAPRWLLRQFDFHASVMGFGVNGALWSLSIEAIFYAFLPLVAGLFFRNPRLGFALGVGGAIAWRWLAFHLPSVAAIVGAGNAVGGTAPRLVEQFPGYLGHFTFGMAAAYLYVAGRTARKRGNAPGWATRPLLFQLGLLALLLVSMVGYGSVSKDAADGVYARYFDDLIPSFAFAGLMLTTALGSARAQWAMANPFARWLGDVSYGAFLWHFPLILLFSHTLGWIRGTGDAQFFGLTALVLPGSLLLGWISRRFIEDPAIAWARTKTRPS
ncbi:MAG: acyltransferase [Candidatus Binatia bacterium]|nr:acyltransferase [Candidatus Binatia bacterium]